ncbi:MAG TPA: hypothetical protein VMD91_14645 [Candidatus Sulfotelmatobacter sp.]|nr:hypothetical protein [Candidatus Sulfotelmatobacter sp.]
MARDLAVSVVNETKGGLELIAFLQNEPFLASTLVAAWEYVFLAGGGASWDFVLPSTFEVSGLAAAEPATRTQLLEARERDQFEITAEPQEPTLPTTIARIGHAAADGAISVRNGLAAAPVWAVLSKSGQPVLSTFLDPRASVDYTVPATLYLALVSGLRRGDTFSPGSEQLTSTWAFPYAGFDALRVVASDGLGGAVSLSGRLS